ncbi:MAG: sulfatase-like hydrolase/transferase [Bryobacterales bacterium]|nr:sulfatase-like hydrolase/transferase [Bryobacterales bacterium]
MPRLALLTLLFSLALSAANKPNIVILLADDLGFHDVGFHGGEIRTPNIDKLAEEGVQLERFYVHPVCSPTRAGLMTGRYPIRFGSMRAVYPPWRKGGLDPAEKTIADGLAAAGYKHRGVFGKWHLGHSDVKYHPLRRGFTEFFGHYNGAIDYFTHEREGELDWHAGYETAHDEGYSTDVVASKAADFIKRHAAEGPYLCYVPFNAPHSPFQALESDMDPYRTLEAVPGKWGADGQRRKNRRILGGMIAALDRGVGTILSAIDASGERDETLVLFLSDNGGVGGISSNYPLRDAKASVFEGGIRVPAAVRWPAAFEGGRKTSSPMANIDVMPTVLAAAGVHSAPGKPLDGRNLLDVWSGKTERMGRELYNYIGQQGEDSEQVSVITPEWKLVVIGPPVNKPEVQTPKREIYLFEIERDPNENENVAAEHPVIVDWLMAKAREFRSLQPANAVPPYNEGKEGFKAPKEWRLPGQ